MWQVIIFTILMILSWNHSLTASLLRHFTTLITNVLLRIKSKRRIEEAAISGNNQEIGIVATINRPPTVRTNAKFHNFLIHNRLHKLVHLQSEINL